MSQKTFRKQKDFSKKTLKVFDISEILFLTFCLTFKTSETSHFLLVSAFFSSPFWKTFNTPWPAWSHRGQGMRHSRRGRGLGSSTSPRRRPCRCAGADPDGSPGERHITSKQKNIKTYVVYIYFQNMLRLVFRYFKYFM